MIAADTLVHFAVTCLLIELTPGPNMAYIAILSLSTGKRAGIMTVAGIATGLLLIGAVAAMGVATLIAGSPLAYAVLRWSGVAFLLWLAWSSWHGDAELSPERVDGVTQANRYFRRGFIINILNPKAAAFYVVVLPEFVVMTGDVMQQTLIFTALYIAIATFIHLLIVLLAGHISPFLKRSRQRIFVRRIMALLLACVGIWFAISTGNAR